MTTEQLKAQARFIDRNFRVYGADNGLERNMSHIEYLKEVQIATNQEASTLWNYARARRYGNPIERQFAMDGDHISR